MKNNIVERIFELRNLITENFKGLQFVELADDKSEVNKWLNELKELCKEEINA